MSESPYLPIYQLSRGETVESVHYGAIAVTDKEGELKAWYGDPRVRTFLRSTAKPFQALPFIEDGGAVRFQLTHTEIALICASHSGTDEHVSVAQSLQKKAKIAENNLLCGVHPPYHIPTLERLREQNETPTPIRNNCSGKHSGMLAYARLKDWPLEDYINPNHPVQRMILDRFAKMCQINPDDIELGIDGCSAPNFAIPIFNAALGYARLCDPSDLPEQRAEACRTITRAMIKCPQMVGGPERFDTVLMQTAEGRLISKGGAEGFQGIGIMPDALFPGSPSLGIVIKIADGDARGLIRAAVTLEVLRQLNALSTENFERLFHFGPELLLHNWRKLDVGAGKPHFTLNSNH